MTLLIKDNLNEFYLFGVKLTFHPKTNKDGWYFTTKNKISGKSNGFLNKSIAKSFGYKMTKNNFKENAKHYIESNKSRKKTFLTYKS